MRKVYTCRYCRLNAGVFLFICIFLKPVFLFVSAIVVIVFIMLSLVKFLSKKLLSWTGNTDKLTYHDKYVALFSNLIGWRTGCYTVQLSCSIDSLEKLFGYWFLKQFNPLNQLKLRTYVLTEKIYFSLFWENFVKSISYINLYIFFGNELLSGIFLRVVVRMGTEMKHEKKLECLDIQTDKPPIITIVTIIITSIMVFSLS